MKSIEQEQAVVSTKSTPKRHNPYLLGRYRTLLPADELHRVRAAESAARGGDVHPPRFPHVLLSGALVGQASRCDTAACAGALAAQGVGLRRFCYQPRLGLIAHFSLGDGPGVWSWAAGTGVILGFSYFFWRGLQPTRDQF